MLNKSTLEYRCSRCGYINVLPKGVHVDMYKERIECCQNCKRPIQVIAAPGLESNINLIVSTPDEEVI